VWDRVYMITGFCLGIIREKDHLEVPHIEEWIILKWSFRKWNGVKYWIEVFKGRGRRRKLVNAVMNSKCCIMCG